MPWWVVQTELVERLTYLVKANDEKQAENLSVNSSPASAETISEETMSIYRYRSTPEKG